MIIVGYQGIGKSTLGGGASGFIDLESSSFWVDGKRDPNWAKVYADIAVRLSAQGYHVFTASHKAVREALKCHPEIYDSSGLLPNMMAVCYPIPSLQDPWIKRLKTRYENTHSDKDYKAWKNAEEMYLENVMDLSDEPLSVIHIPIVTMDYDLKEELMKHDICQKGAGVVGV